MILYLSVALPPQPRSWGRCRLKNLNLTDPSKVKEPEAIFRMLRAHRRRSDLEHSGGAEGDEGVVHLAAGQARLTDERELEQRWQAVLPILCRGGGCRV